MARLMVPQSAAPMREMNTTPLIDVMLVLLIMFLIALPVVTHKVPLQLPAVGTPSGVVPPTHILSIDASGNLAWNGEAVSRSGLIDRLEAAAIDPDLPRLEIRASAEARYERVDEILADVSRAGVTRLGFEGIGAFANAF